MVIDTSALVAVVLDEPESISLIEQMAVADRLRLSAVSLFEASTVLLSRAGQSRVDLLEELLDRFSVEIVPVDRAMALGAFEAFRVYGRGRHPAGLNFGDCFPYALAKHGGERLLFKGNDFSRTDLKLA